MIARNRMFAAALMAAGAFSLFTVDVAEARRGGSFGSRGMRTYSAPAPTRTAPQATAPIQRSMTPQRPGAQQAARAPAAARAQPPRTGMFSNPLVRGLLLGGLIGALLGFGFGGAGGAMAALMQVAMFALAGLVIFKLFQMFSSRRKGQPATAQAGGGYGSAYEVQQPAEPNRYFNLGGSAAADTPSEPSDEIGITQVDLDAFESLLKQVQTAFGAEDYAALRAVTTPEIMSYLSEELSQNATSGRRNEVTDIRLDQADLSEAWHEDGDDYATAAMRYSSRDVMKDRNTGAVISGDGHGPSQTTELWTFVRQSGQPWKLSAIQDA